MNANHDELTGTLAAAVIHARSDGLPAASRARALARVAAMLEAEPARPRHRTVNRFTLARAACLTFLLLVAGIVAIWFAHHSRNGTVARHHSAPRTTRQPPTTNTQPRGVAVPPLAAGLDGAVAQEGFGAIPAAPPRGGLMAGASPSRPLAVAEDAPVLVTTGGDQPIDLGAQQKWTPETRLHVWDWSKEGGHKSRPLKATAHSFAVSTDGKTIVTADGKAIDLVTEVVAPIDNFAGNVKRMTFSPDGKSLLLQVAQAAGDGYAKPAVARLLEFPSGKKLREIPDYWQYTFAAAFTHDGAQVVLMDRDRFVKRYDARTGKELAKYEPQHENSIRMIAVSPDGKLLASAGTRGDIHLWEMSTGKHLHRLVAHQKPDIEGDRFVDSIAFSPDGELLAGGGIHSLLLWDTGTGEVKKIFPRNSAGAVRCRFIDEGRKIETVHDFHGVITPAGEDLLVYPSVREWVVEE